MTRLMLVIALSIAFVGLPVAGCGSASPADHPDAASPEAAPQDDAAPLVRCGDGRLDPGEECDGDLLGGATCQSLGFAAGTLSCGRCVYDTSACDATSWPRRFAGAGYREQLSWIDVVRDGDANVVVVGGYSPATVGPLDAGGGPLPTLDIIEDAFVAKYDARGIHLWSQRLGDGRFNRASGVTLDHAGNILVTGSSVAYSSDSSDPGWPRVFVVKLTPGGEVLWRKRFPTTSWYFQSVLANIGLAIKVDAADDIVVVGTFDQSIDLGGTTLVAPGFDQFVVKLDPDGQHRWSRQFHHPDTGDMVIPAITSVLISRAGDIIVSGASDGALDFGGGPVAFPPGTTWLSYVVALRKDGSLHWSQQLYPGVVVRAAALDAQDGVVAVGELATAGATADLGGGLLEGEGVLVVRYTAAGDFDWNRLLPGNACATAAAVTPQGDVLAGGWFGGHFGVGPDALVKDPGSQGGFIARLNGAGEPLGVVRAGAGSITSTVVKLVPDSAGAALVAGYQSSGLGDEMFVTMEAL